MRTVGGLSSLLNNTPGSLSAASFLPTFLGKNLTKAQRKKLLSRRRRLFVDRVVIAHKRIHDKNRDLIIENTKKRLSLKKEKKSSISPYLDKNKDHKWRNRVRPKFSEVSEEKDEIKEVNITPGKETKTWLQKVTDNID